MLVDSLSDTEKSLENLQVEFLQERQLKLVNELVTLGKSIPTAVVLCYTLSSIEELNPEL